MNFHNILTARPWITHLIQSQDDHYTPLSKHFSTPAIGNIYQRNTGCQPTANVQTIIITDCACLLHGRSGPLY